jgi:WD40 repeat protein
MSAPDDSPAPTRGDSWRRVVLLSLIVLVIAGGSAGYLLLSRQHKTVKSGSAIPSTLTIDLSDSNFYCPQASAWSPDGRQLAVLVADITCREAAYQASPTSAKIAIFDTASRKLLQTITVADVLNERHLTGLFSAMAWTPDGQSLAVFVQDAYSSVTTTNTEELILYPTATPSQAPRLISAPQPLLTPQLTTQVLVWNLHTSGAGPVIAPELPAALTYRWTADGHIVADQAIPADVSAPTGRVSESGSFSLWQNGQIVPEALNQGHYYPADQKPAAEFFTSAPALWSPDGQYVVFGLSLGGPVAITQPASGAAHAMPMPDQAFSAVVKAVDQGETLTESDGTAIPDWTSVPVQWSPNGKFLLTILPGNEHRQGSANTTLTVYSTASGQAVKQYRQADNRDSSCGPGFLPGWSPTGRQVALAQCGIDSITIWNTSDLSS